MLRRALKSSHSSRAQPLALMSNFHLNTKGLRLFLYLKDPNLNAVNMDMDAFLLCALHIFVDEFSKLEFNFKGLCSTLLFPAPLVACED